MIRLQWPPTGRSAAEAAIYHLYSQQQQQLHNRCVAGCAEQSEKTARVAAQSRAAARVWHFPAIVHSSCTKRVMDSGICSWWMGHDDGIILYSMRAPRHARLQSGSTMPSAAFAFVTNTGAANCLCSETGVQYIAPAAGYLLLMNYWRWNGNAFGTVQENTIELYFYMLELIGLNLIRF